MDDNDNCAELETRDIPGETTADPGLEDDVDDADDDEEWTCISRRNADPPLARWLYRSEVLNIPGMVCMCVCVCVRKEGKRFPKW